MPARSNACGLLWIVAAWGLAAGCNRSEFDIAPVAGTVTLNGQPLADARVSFHPRASGDRMRAGPDSYARTDADGRYELETLDGHRGAVVATHRVRIRTRREEETKDGSVIVITPEKLPARYHDSTELTFQVTGKGTDSADFSLASD